MADGRVRLQKLVIFSQQADSLDMHRESPFN